ncbi:hypothetical protein P7K49_028549 [Saguinus oedipus]|uniref:Uncharacterized protein n=1 Tax=Saguinus oedipus TaxID=9490 RepID=A0ABQ9U4R7_SAGOE|nr:hypothetical protein P7K49_028549 [Saguinus oedipus]
MPRIPGDAELLTCHATKLLWQVTAPPHLDLGVQLTAQVDFVCSCGCGRLSRAPELPLSPRSCGYSLQHPVPQPHGEQHPDVQADTFRQLHHLEVLHLNTLELFHIWLTVISSGAFEYLSKLRELWLHNNAIESIPSYSFNWVPSLLCLDLGELKKLEYISEGAFEGLLNLKYLNLGMGNIKGTPNLTPLVGLEELEVSGELLP